MSDLQLTPKIVRTLEENPVHPLLFALSPVLTLLANNAYEVRLADGARALLLSAIAGVILLALSYLSGNRRHRVAVIETALITLFFTYGHFYEWGRQLSSWTFALVRHRYLLPASVALLVGLVFLLRARRGWARGLTPGLNAASLVLVVLPLITVARSEAQFMRASSAAEGSDTSACDVEGYQLADTSDASQDESRRDIYYIILDAYTRQDVMETTYNFDNRPFLRALEDRGFYVARGSQSNYGSTGLSLASSLNMEYHSFPEGISESDNPTQHWPSLSRSRVRRLLECRGYYVVAFDSGYYWSGWQDADAFLSPAAGREETIALAGLNAFEALLVNTTVLRAAVDAAIALPSFLSPDIQNPTNEHRERILYAFDTLEGGVTSLPSPKFVFAHIVSPHRPFLFGPHGAWRETQGPFTLAEREVDVSSETEAYPAQVQYVNARILNAVDAIRSSYPADKQPIIMIQGDHGVGSGANDRMRILSAYYLPADGDGSLYPTISPVNSFRVVFDYYFGADLDLLPDVSCYSGNEHLYDFRVIPNPKAQDPAGDDMVSICG